MENGRSFQTKKLPCTPSQTSSSTPSALMVVDFSRKGAKTPSDAVDFHHEGHEEHEGTGNVQMH
jgi:hypothetical protein